jgi:hypothetical protein
MTEWSVSTVTGYLLTESHRRAARVEQKWNVRGGFMGNTKRRRPLGKPGLGWEGNIEIGRKK